MQRMFHRSLLAVAFLWSVAAPEAEAMDWTKGTFTAVPTKGGQPPKIDGDLGDWDLSAQEPVYIAEQTARLLNAEWALMYDEEALYIGARAALPNRPLHNPSQPQDAFWQGDLFQLRLAADPALPYPLDRGRDAASDRVAHISLWKNTATGLDYLHINRGVALDKGQVANPPGSQIVITTQGNTGYIAEARLPWSALLAPGGKNPFKAGDRMAFVAENLWVGGDQARVALGYRTNPGTFAFNQPQSWGVLEFAPQGLGQRRRSTMAQLFAQIDAAANRTASLTGVPITFQVPAEGLKVSVNIFGPDGQVLRELIGGEAHPQGPLTVRWDGKDAWGSPLEPNSYHWGAYFHRGLKAEYAGAVGAAGNPPYPTLDGKGSWGGDHSDPLDCAADESGLYFMWPVAEAGRPIVKTDYDGKVLWRKNPFVGGGFGPFYAIATDGKFVYLTLGDQKVRLVRLDAANGELLTWGEGGPTELPVHEVKAAGVPQSSTPVETHGTFFKTDAQVQDPHLVAQPDAVGLAVRNGELFLSSYALNKILVLNANDGKLLREISCPGPRGLSFDPVGNLYAVSYVAGKSAQIMRFASAGSVAVPVVRAGLEAPYDVAVAANGRLYVSDLGKSHQIKFFDAQGAPISRLGKAGGRAWQGKYDAKAFLNPAGIALDARGGLLVVESAIPRVISRLQASNGKVLSRWFGPGVYWNSTWPMPDDPTSVFYSLGGGFGRGRVGRNDENRTAEAYWAPDKAGYTHVGNIEDGMPQPEVVRASNGQTYLVADTRTHPIFLLRDNRLQPVATWRGIGTDKNRFPQNKLGRFYIEVWIDANGDGQVQESEKSQLSSLSNGQPVPQIADLTSSLHMEPNGDLYFVTQNNSILKVPCTGWQRNGTPRWDTTKASLAVPTVLPGQEQMSTTWRHGILGVRLDKGGNYYTVFNTRVNGKGGPFNYPSEQVAARQLEGMGHTATFNVVKFAKYDPQGKLLWMSGRKATAGAKPGEMYHFWNIAGLANDRYIAGASEWGQVYFYTHDGFYVDAIMNNPALAPPPGPYTFGGETSGGRIQYFPNRDELWAYSSGMAYRVQGFRKGAVEGEQRIAGIVKLDKVYETAPEPAARQIEPLQIMSLTGDATVDANLWANVPVATLTRDAQPLATAQIGYDARYLYGRIRVNAPTTGQNSADTVQLAFKGGDSAGIVLGPAGDNKTPGAGDIRLMVAPIGGKPCLIAMKAVTAGNKQPFEYFTPAAGTVRFEFVGEVPGGKVLWTPDANGYTATFAVPRSFLEFDLKPGNALKGDVEVRLSGAGARGLQTTSRNYLFTPSRTETTMTDDVPTEARLYPQYWGEVKVR